MTIRDRALKAGLAAALTQRQRGELTLDLINSTPDDELAELIFDAHWARWGKEFGGDTGRLLASLPEGARYLCLTTIAEGQVSNGGFAQLYQNGYGYFAEDIVRAFDYFAAAEYAALTREANQIYRKNRLLIWLFSGRTGLLLRHLFQRDLLPSKLPELELLDNHFYAMEGDLAALRIAQIRLSPGSFLPRML